MIQPGRILPQRANGMTLVEVLVALAISTVLMGAIASTILLAGHCLPDAASPLFRVLDASEALDRMAEDLQCARYITERTSRAITVITADRNGDGQCETIRYSWSGVSGQGLLRQVNGQAPATVCPNVQSLKLTFHTRDVTETVSGPGVERSEQTLLHNHEWDERSDYHVTSSKWIGQYFRPELPAGTLYWRMTRLQIRAEGEGPAATRVDIRRAGTDGIPTSESLGLETLWPGTLETWTQTHTIWVGDVEHVLPDEGLALVLWSWASAAEIEYERDAGTALLTSGDGGTSWTRHADRSLPLRIYGRITEPGPDKTITRRLVEAVDIQLQVGTDAGWSTRTAVGLLNAPETLSRVWESDFDADPTTADLDADGTGDWTVAGAGSFSAGALADGVWTATQVLATAPDDDFAELTTVELRFRGTASSAGPAWFRIHFDRDLSKVAPVLVSLQLESDGTQTLTLFGKPSGSERTALARVSGLDSGFQHVRLLLDPDDDTVNLRVNGSDRGTFGLPRYVPSSPLPVAAVWANSSGGAFDFVSVRLGDRP